jgi:uncharacterized protein (DUF1501 family)
MASNRRRFLRTSLGASAILSLAPHLPAFLARAVRAAGPRDQRDTILVVVQMAGGNDGLNTVVPYEDDNYARNRSTLRLTARDVLKIDAPLGFHPRMGAMRELYQRGLVSVVQGVGYPNPHQQHEQAMLVWQTADTQPVPDETGWVGRAVDGVYREESGRVPAVFCGDILRPRALVARRAFIPAWPTVQPWKFRDLPLDLRRHLAESAKFPRSADNPLLDFVQRSTVATYHDLHQIEAAANSSGAAPGDRYPASSLARLLRCVAQWIRADLGIRIFFTELGGAEPGGFDNHAAQRDNHAALLAQFSDALAAFTAELARDKLLDRVLLMTFSEFGRTLAENGRRGTDHGSAAPVFLVGGKLKGGLVGRHPGLTELENNGPAFHTDFRRVYATVLERWLGFDSRPVLGGDFRPLDVLA